MVATSMNLCTQVLASKLDKGFINYFPAGPFDPFFTTIYPNSNRRAFMPNPLSYNPQAGSVVASQHMVGCYPLHMSYVSSCWDNIGMFEVIMVAELASVSLIHRIPTLSCLTLVWDTSSAGTPSWSVLIVQTFLQRLWNVGRFLHFVTADYIYLRPITAGF